MRLTRQASMSRTPAGTGTAGAMSAAGSVARSSRCGRHQGKQTTMRSRSATSSRAIATRKGRESPMTTYEFTLRLNREVTDTEVEALYEAGCDDAAVETGPLGARIDFDREAPSLAEAIASAVRDIEKVPGLRAIGVVCDNMVTLRDIAERSGVDREAVRLWA